ncbi:MAG: hypothetical protein LBL41_01545 [Bifidobacteriaceae bacterium]|jgi:hypothetical protein|nr:hypothetical protein [Bifidobacteriaceae bacterium]
MEIDYYLFPLVDWIGNLHFWVSDYNGKTIGDAYEKFKELGKFDYDTLVEENPNSDYFNFVDDGIAKGLANWLENEPELHGMHITNIQNNGGVSMMTLCDNLENPDHVYVYAMNGYYDDAAFFTHDHDWEQGNDVLLNYINALPESYGNNIEVIGNEAGSNNAVYAKMMSDRVGLVHAINGAEYPEEFMDKYAVDLNRVKEDVREYVDGFWINPGSYIDLSPHDTLDIQELWYYGTEDSIDDYNKAKGTIPYPPKQSVLVKSPSFYVPGGYTYTYESRAVTHGMDLASTEQLAAKMLESADKIKDVLSSAGVTLDATSWLGPDIQEFKEKWQGLFAKQLQLAATALVESSEVVEANRKEQVAASE